MEYILKYINDNLSQHLSLREVAAYAGYSSWHFCEKFKLYTGSTFTEYLRNRRMQLAVNGLLRGRKTAELAMELGYETESGFERAFYRQYGCSPTDYKENADYYTARSEQRRANRLHLTDRCQILREQALKPGRQWDANIGLYSYHFWKGFYNLPPEKRSNYSTQAAGYATILSELVPVIHSGELIVGETFPSMHIEQMERGIIDIIRRQPSRARDYLKRGPLTQEQTEQLFTWAAREDCRWPYTPGKATRRITSKEQLRQREGAALGDCSVDTHSVLNYRKVLQKGFDGILQELRKAAEKSTPEQREFYEGCVQVCAACCGIGDKHAALAARLSEQAATEPQKKELQALATVCARVPRYPARSFREAVQSLYFAHVLNTLEDGVNSNSLGRVDQLLYPYYRADIDEGRMTHEEAFELICCLWLKLYRGFDVQQCTLGGVDENGNDCSNDLSYLIFDATEELNLVRCLSVRYGAKTPPEFLRRALEVLCYANKGINSFCNDEVFIPALTRRGISRCDASDYALIGCAEICIPGKSNAHPVTARCNLLKALEYALTGGESMTHAGTYPGVRRKNTEFRSFDSLKKAVLLQLESLLDTAVSLTLRQTRIRTQEWPQFYKSILTEGCVERGLSYCNRGALYDFDEVMLLGLPNLADSLIAVKQLVFEEQRYTLAQLIQELRENFPDRQLRNAFLYAAPKYGNGIAAVDALAAELMEHACRHLERVKSEVSDGFFAQMFSYRWCIDHGALMPASPDGRRAGEPLADGVSPASERDVSGVSAALQSIAALPAMLSPGGFSATIDVDSFLFNDYHLELLTQLLVNTSKRGLGSIQWNIQDARLSLAKADRELAVQVFGIRQHYDLLDSETRAYIAERTKHQLL